LHFFGEMKFGIRRRLPIILLLATLILSPPITTRPILAFETDQYDLPPTPLADIGEEVAKHVDERLREAVSRINADISRREDCATVEDRNPTCGAVADEIEKLAYLRSADGLAYQVYKELGSGIPPFTSMGTWMDTHRFKGQPARYRPSFFKSIFIPLPHVALTTSPTVLMYGSEFGTDKVAHFFQQGYRYFEIYRRARQKGLSPDAATHEAVLWGRKSEERIFGVLISGVYSNGDLASNYAGMKFYESLTQPVRIGSGIQPSLLRLQNGTWVINEGASLRECLKLLISDHFNEALNPSIFTPNFGLRWYVRREVRRRACKQWFARNPNLSQSELEEESIRLRLWHGDDYGFTGSEDFVTIANTCFESNEIAPQAEPHPIASARVTLINSRAVDH
jgi:hypothetical protein